MDAMRKAAFQPDQNSQTAAPIPNSEPKPSKQVTSDAQSIETKPQVNYTVFIRLPFPRSGFEDPPPLQWDAAKDKAMWKFISKASTSKELDWQDMSAKFEVTLPFLLQQAAWLYERHIEGVRAQMKKLSSNGPSGSNPQPVQGDNGSGTTAESVGMTRTRSKDSKIPSAIVTQKNSPHPTGEMSSPATPRSHRPNVSRTPSTNTVTQSRVFGSTPRAPSQVLARPSSRSKARAPRTGQTDDLVHNIDDDSDLGHDGTSESESEEEPSAMARSQAFRRSPLSKKPVMSTLSSDGDLDDDEDDDSGGYLPFAAASKTTKNDPAATIRNSPQRQIANPQQTSTAKAKPKEPPPDSPASSASSAQPTQSSHGNPDTNNRPGPLSPKYRAELERLSPRHKKSGSEGSPSLGSSFSDLDDAGVTQSALEDALLSNMQHGSIGIGVGSRISTLRDALAKK